MLALLLALACAGTTPTPDSSTSDASAPDTIAWLSLGDKQPRFCLSPVVGATHLPRSDRKALQAARDAVAAGAQPDLATLPDHPATDVLRGAERVLAGDDEGAREVFRDLANVWTDDACVQQAAAFASFRAGQFAYGRPYMTAALELWPDDPDVGLLGVIYQIVGDGEPDQALGSLRRLALQHPDSVAIATWLGRTLARRGLYDEALPPLLTAWKAGIDVSLELLPTSRIQGDLDTYLSLVGVSPPLPVDLREADDRVAGYEDALGIVDGGELWVDIATTKGDLHCQLYWRQAPLTVANFVSLSRGLAPWTDPATGEQRTDPLYPGVVFHRVIPGFMIQTGDPLGTGTGGPGWQILDEISPDLRFDRPGLLAMANSGPNTNGSQWFITEVPTPHLDGKHTIFGACDDDSLAVVKAIARVPVGDQDKPVDDVVIESLQFR